MELRGPAGFRDISLCGVGATSRVYRAVEVASGRVLALKRLHRQLVRDGSALARLRRELLSLRRIRHSGIVAALDIIDWEDAPTIVMEYVPGEDLKERILREGRLTRGESERIARALFEVLAVTHASGIVHRDVKPQNVRLGEDGRVYLLDFGSARLDAASQLTRTGTTVGTPEYMAPELFAASVYDPRVDIYGVGATVYECLTGQPPQSADSLAELAVMRTTVDVRPVAEVAPEAGGLLGRVVDRCLEREPEGRYASAGLALWALDHPEVEAACQARRSSNPPCLHCGRAIPADSTTCGHCHQYQPFAYPPGPYHVELRSLREPGRFIEYVATQFPDRATPEHLEALAHRCAALAFGPQRYVSFIDWLSAERVKATLAEHGVRAEITTNRGALFTLIVSGLVGAFAVAKLADVRTSWTIIISCSALAGILAWLGLRPLRRASHGILSTTKGPRPTSPVLASLAFAGSLVSMLLVLFALVVRPLLNQPVPYECPLFLTTLAVSVLLLVVCHRSQSPFPRTGPGGDPQRRDRWLFELFNGGPALAGERVDCIPLSSRANESVVAVTVLLMIAAEVVVVALGPGLAEDLGRRWRAPAPLALGEKEEAIPEWLKKKGPDEQGGRGRRRKGAGTPQPRAQPEAGRPSRAAVHAKHSKATALVPFAVGLPLIGLALRRGRRVRRDAAEIFAALDLPALAPLAGRDWPIRRGEGGRLGAGDWFACRCVGDAFFASALARAAELAHWLPPEALATLAGALEAVCARMPAYQQAERSLLARCILETDPEQRTRFEFLALEGRMEAAAAEAWAARLQEAS